MVKMYWVTNFVHLAVGGIWFNQGSKQIFYNLFMLPKPGAERLSARMNDSNPQWQPSRQPADLAALYPHKESTLKLNLETRNRGDVMIVYCQGRIVYRDEAVALSRVVADVVKSTNKVVLDLGGVSSIDSAGMGELAFLQSWSQARNVSLKWASPSPLVRDLLGLTNLDRVLDLHSSLTGALESFRESHQCEEQVC
jgi:anti-sigma B factor antagonist